MAESASIEPEVKQPTSTHRMKPQGLRPVCEFFMSLTETRSNCALECTLLLTWNTTLLLSFICGFAQTLPVQLREWSDCMVSIVWWSSQIQFRWDSFPVDTIGNMKCDRRFQSLQSTVSVADQCAWEEHAKVNVCENRNRRRRDSKLFRPRQSERAGHWQRFRCE